MKPLLEQYLYRVLFVYLIEIWLLFFNFDFWHFWKLKGCLFTFIATQESFHVWSNICKYAYMDPVVQKVDSAIHRINHYPADRAVFNWVSKVITQLLWFCIATVCDWLKNLAPLSQPIRNKTKTNRVLLARVFPRLAPATCICFELWLVHWIV